MQTDPTPGVLILGANGRFGRAAADAFASAGWCVYVQSRSSRAQAAPDMTAITCDALDMKTVLEAVTGKIDVVVNALNPPYTEWEQRVPALADAALHIARQTGSLLMLPGNVYNFGTRLPAVLHEDTPQLPDTSKGKIRVALEEQMRQAARDGVRSVVIRAGDFLGAGPGTWMDMVIAKNLARGKLAYPGAMPLEHPWAYLPDLARVFVAVAERRAQLTPFDVLHYGGLTCTGTALTEAISRAADRPLTVSGFPWGLLRLASPFSPMLRALLEMRYLWDRPHRLSEEKLARLIGTIPRTDLGEVMRALVRDDSSIEKTGAPTGAHLPSPP